MERIWQMRQARVKLSEVIRSASLYGPQILTRRGVEVAVVLSHAEYLQLKGKQTPLSEFFRRSPLGGLDLERAQSPGAGDQECPQQVVVDDGGRVLLPGAPPADRLDEGSANPKDPGESAAKAHAQL